VALAALTKVSADRAAWLGAEALRRIVAAPLSNRQRFLLGDCVQAYLHMDQEHRQEFERLIALPQYQGVKAMNATWFDQGLEKGLRRGHKEGLEKGLEKGLKKGRAEGRKEGRAEGRRAALRDLLEQRFGRLSPRVIDRLEQVPEKRLVKLTRAVLRADSLKELGLDD
jgi:flagellar biosynthesis/type III secretory pathway protein FliH